MIDDARLAKLLVDSGLLARETLEDLVRERDATHPPRSLFDLVLGRGLATEDRIRQLIRGSEPGLETMVAPRMIGKFELQGELGRGGMGVVYRAWQPDLRRHVALKVIPSGADPIFRERFLREARVASRLRHPHIVPVHEYGEADGSAYFVMDCIDGSSFDAAMKALPLEDNARILSTVARALHHAHVQGLVHRDIKPQNILVAKDGTPYLTDFGLAREVDTERPLTLTGQILGTPAFMSPEQARGGKTPPGPASDIYSLGAVLYVLLAGRPPFCADSVYELLDAIIHRPPESPAGLNSGVPQALEAVCLRCLEKDPARRYPSAEALAADLDRALVGAVIEGAASAWATTRVDLAPVRRRRVAAGVAGGLLAAALLAALMLRGTPAPPDPDALDAAAFGSVSERSGSSWTWRTAFTDPRQVRDWEIQPYLSRGTQPYDARATAAGLELRNVEAHFPAPLEGEASLAVVFAEAPRGPQAGIGLAGWTLVRGPDHATLTSPAGQGSTRPLEAASAGERLELALLAAEVVVRVSGQELIRAPLPDRPEPLRPSIFAQGNTVARFASAELRGRPRADWARRRARELREFAQVGAGYPLEPAQDLLAGGPTGGFKSIGGGTGSRAGGGLKFLGFEDRSLELHGPNFRNSRIRLKYASTAPLLNLRFRAGYRDVQVPLPTGGSAVREAEVVALEYDFRCLVDGALVVTSSMANGTDLDQISLRLKARGGELTLLQATVEPVAGVPAQDPWFMLFSGMVQGLVPSPDWKVEAGGLHGSGKLATISSWPAFEVELIMDSRPGTRLSFGAGGRAGLLQAEAVPMYGGNVSAFTFRTQGGLATLESDRTFSAAQAPTTPGGFQLQVSGGPVKILSLRLRSLK